MKEWCLKHPWMTFFLIEWISCDIANAIAGRKSKTSFERVGGVCHETWSNIKEKIDETKRKEKVIGFKAS